MESWPRLYLLFTPELCAGDPWHVLREALAGGVGLVQWRVAHRDPDGLQRCITQCRASGVPVLVNDDVELAIHCGADGAHVGQQDMPAAQARQRLGSARLLGVSTHDPAQIDAAVAAGADHVGFGPCFPTPTKGYREGLPPAARRRAFAHSPVPLFAIGGITAANLPLLRAEGCTRVAVASSILGAADPQAAAAELSAALR